MIQMLILTIGAFGQIMLAMAVGVIFKGKALRGSRRRRIVRLRRGGRTGLRRHEGA